MVQHDNFILDFFNKLFKNIILIIIASLLWFFPSGYFISEGAKIYDSSNMLFIASLWTERQCQDYAKKHDGDEYLKANCTPVSVGQLFLAEIYAAKRRIYFTP
jgi:hypothetical protein